MIVSERLTTYINSLDSSKNVLCSELEEYAAKNYVPIIRRETASFLRTMILMNRPKNILEIGTAIGYSSIIMSMDMPKDCHITTIENYEKRIPIAKSNFERAGISSNVTLLEGDAGKILKNLEGSYDFIFMDAAKGQYLSWLDDIMRLMPDLGVLISDNVLQDGNIIESKYAVIRRNRTIHSRIREYLYVLKHNKQLQTSILSVGDGIALSVKCNNDY